MVFDFLKFKKNFSYKDKADKIKNKVIRKDVNRFKKLCIKEFESNIERGITTTIVDFFTNVSYDFENEISEIVLKELREEYKNINFTFSFRHFQNSYKGICMIAT